jgi:hypothetical protein
VNLPPLLRGVAEAAGLLERVRPAHCVGVDQIGIRFPILAARPVAETVNSVTVLSTINRWGWGR